MKKRILFLILIATMLVSFVFDNDIVLFVDSIKNDTLDNIFEWFTNVITTVVILFVMTTLFLWETRKREWI